MTLFEEQVETFEGMPVLMPMQSDLIERGRAAFDPANGIRRVVFQAACAFGKTVVASEQTRRALEKGKKVLHIVHLRRLVDQMIGTLRQFNIHASPIMQGRQTWNADVFCASRDTLLAMLKDGIDLPRADLIIWDECHVGAAALWDWYRANCPNALWVGYTATPIRPDGKSLSPPFQRIVCGAPASKMIEAGRLCPVVVYNPDAIGRRRRKGEKVKPVGDPVQHWKKYANGLPTIAFASKVSDSVALVERYNAAGITAEHIDASTSDDDRDAVFERSKEGKTLVISNVGICIMGVDLPWLVCCQILRGCNSLVLWAQANGRVMRAWPGKSHGICLDHAGAAHEFGLPDSDYEWSLEDESENVRKNKLPKDRKPITCPACGLVFKPKPACPGCGRVLPKKNRRSTFDSMRPDDGLLTQFSEGQNEFIRQDKLNRIFTQCFWTARAKGAGMNMAAAMFKSKTHLAPWEAGLSLHLPGPGEWKTPAKEWEIA